MPCPFYQNIFKEIFFRPPPGSPADTPWLLKVVTDACHLTAGPKTPIVEKYTRCIDLAVPGH
jgi:hypothetical protein